MFAPLTYPRTATTSGYLSSLPGMTAQPRAGGRRRNTLLADIYNIVRRLFRYRRSFQYAVAGLTLDVALFSSHTRRRLSARQNGADTNNSLRHGRADHHGHPAAKNRHVQGRMLRHVRAGNPRSRSWRPRPSLGAHRLSEDAVADAATHCCAGWIPATAAWKSSHNPLFYFGGRVGHCNANDLG